MLTAGLACQLQAGADHSFAMLSASVPLVPESYIRVMPYAWWLGDFGESKVLIRARRHLEWHTWHWRVRRVQPCIDLSLIYNLSSAMIDNFVPTTGLI